jgi:hypothetical protein
VGLFRQIKDLHSEPAPVIGSAQVLSVESALPEGARGVEVALEISAPGREPYQIITSLRVPLRHAADVVPGAMIPVWVEDTNRENVVVAWDD